MPQPVLSTKMAGQDIALVERTSLALEVMPHSFGELREFAQIMSESEWLPAHFKGKPANCLLVCLQAYRWGMDPVAVAQQTYFAKAGQPAYMAQLIHALVLARAPLKGRLRIKFSGHWPNRICTVSGTFQGDDEPQVYEINASTIKTRNSPLWVSDPDQQLAYFATRGWARRFAPDTIMGIYAPDEMEDVTHSATGHTPSDEPQEQLTPQSKLDALEKVIEGQNAQIGPLAASWLNTGGWATAEEVPVVPLQEPEQPEAPEPPAEPEAPEEPAQEQGDTLGEMLQEQEDLWAPWGGNPMEFARQLAENLGLKRKARDEAGFESMIQAHEKYIIRLSPEAKNKLDTFIIASRQRLRQP